MGSWTAGIADYQEKFDVERDIYYLDTFFFTDISVLIYNGYRTKLLWKIKLNLILL